MTAPHNVPIIATVIHHTPVHVPPPDTIEHYPVNPRWPPDPAIYASVIAYDCRLLDQEMGR